VDRRQSHIRNAHHKRSRPFHRLHLNTERNLKSSEPWKQPDLGQRYRRWNGATHLTRALRAWLGRKSKIQDWSLRIQRRSMGRRWHLLLPMVWAPCLGDEVQRTGPPSLEEDQGSCKETTGFLARILKLTWLDRQWKRRQDLGGSKGHSKSGHPDAQCPVQNARSVKILQNGRQRKDQPCLVFP